MTGTSAEPAGSPRTRSLAAYGWMALSASLFAGMYFFAHLASHRVPWTMVATARAGVGAMVAIGVGKMRGVPVLPEGKGSRQMWLRSLFGTASLLCTFYATGSPDLALGDAITLANLGPVIIAVLAPLMLGERSGRRVAVAIPLSLAGVVCIVRPAIFFGHEVANGRMLLPAVAAIGGSFFASLAMIMLRQVSDRVGPEAIAAHFSLTAAAVMFVLSIPKLTVPAAHDLAIMLAAGLCAGFAQLAMTRAYALEFAARVSPFGYLQVVIGSLLGAVALAQWPDALTFVGMLLVIAGGVFVSIVSLREQRLRA
ncbi:DMT family transporter [Pendulispora albinea]|uniref:DMT family transporter n=1 Tax=Pendulispora albinea TaxID=2741071 RepID=A0ABZ2M0W8_9BACT